VPANATTGEIRLHAGHGHGVAVGQFEVANFDAAAEQKRLDDERRKAAEAAWAQQQAKLAKDEAGRRATVDAREKEWDSTRETRHQQRLAELRAKWDAAFLADADTQAELTLHGQREAEITRMRDVAEIKNDKNLGVRIDVVEQHENQRHDARMAALHDAFGKGGAK
jgi:zona occludens toxin (predicted ATPase)